MRPTSYQLYGMHSLSPPKLKLLSNYVDTRNLVFFMGEGCTQEHAAFCYDSYITLIPPAMEARCGRRTARSGLRFVSKGSVYMNPSPQKMLLFHKCSKTPSGNLILRIVVSLHDYLDPPSRS